MWPLKIQNDGGRAVQNIVERPKLNVDVSVEPIPDLGMVGMCQCTGASTNQRSLSFFCLPVGGNRLAKRLVGLHHHAEPGLHLGKYGAVSNNI